MLGATESPTFNQVFDHIRDLGLHQQALMYDQQSDEVRPASFRHMGTISTIYAFRTPEFERVIIGQAQKEELEIVDNCALLVNMRCMLLQRMDTIIWSSRHTWATHRRPWSGTFRSEFSVLSYSLTELVPRILTGRGFARRPTMDIETCRPKHPDAADFLLGASNITEDQAYVTGFATKEEVAAGREDAIRLRQAAAAAYKEDHPSLRRNLKLIRDPNTEFQRITHEHASEYLQHAPLVTAEIGPPDSNNYVLLNRGRRATEMVLIDGLKPVVARLDIPHREPHTVEKILQPHMLYFNYVTGKARVLKNKEIRPYIQLLEPYNQKV